MTPMVRLELLRVGACRHPECMARRGGSLRAIEFPSLCGLIFHPSRGWILYDTGYASHFFSATEQLPQRLYRTFVPPTIAAGEVLEAQLKARGISSADISLIVVSHFHGDHVAGLRDFPRARILALTSGRDHLVRLAQQPWRATFGGYLPALLPENFSSRFDAVDSLVRCQLPKWLMPFDAGFDLLGDGSLIGVPLPGHGVGQLGLLLPNAAGQPAFLIADAAWSSKALRLGDLPPAVTLRFTSTSNQYRATFTALRKIAIGVPDMPLIPSHCTEAWNRYRAAFEPRAGKTGDLVDVN